MRNPQTVPLKMKLIFGIFLFFISLITNAQTPQTNVDTLSLEDRLWGLTLLWHEVKNDFAFYDKLGFDWDSTYKATFTEVIHTPDRFSYYQTLRRLAARLHDGHTNVYLSSDLREKYLANPPLRLKRIGKRVFAQVLLNDSLKTAGLSEGDEILLINNIPVKEYAEKYVQPYVSASTPQDELNRTYSNELLSGRKEDSLLLTVRSKKGVTKDVFINRGLRQQRAPYERMAFRLLPNHIGLLSLNTFEGNSLLQQFAAILPPLTSCSALIIDLRKNGGGNGDNAYALQDYFFKDGYFDTQGHTRMHVAAWQAFGFPKADMWLDTPKNSLWIRTDTASIKFLKPVVILTGEKTFSAAEDFTATLKQNKRAITIGEATGGSTGMNIYHSLPGGGSFRVIVKKDTFIDGTEFIGVGIQPDIAVQVTVDDFLKGKDIVLQTALNYLEKEAKKK